MFVAVSQILPSLIFAVKAKLTLLKPFTRPYPKVRLVALPANIKPVWK